MGKEKIRFLAEVISNPNLLPSKNKRVEEREKKSPQSSLREAPVKAVEGRPRSGQILVVKMGKEKIRFLAEVISNPNLLPAKNKRELRVEKKNHLRAH
ncbi:hypothetical protein [Cognataquiflexum rubidum]|uniref:hypothetical protein n=1 Tax=Cognataquiflexum rubidum TaxID=2922273 RepID=UPI001F132D0F|nr:hypothetical protein [Cognataquiflexum rubidum]MCH6234660.1 hypothetical protein [Cognataquiflexum rubidum]